MSAQTVSLTGTKAPEAPAAEPAVDLEKKVSDMLAAQISKINSDLRADLGRELKAIKEAVGAGKPKEKEASPAQEHPGESQTEKTLRERLASLEEREGRQRQNAVRLAIRDNLVRAGADTALAELAVPAILEGEGGQFATKEGKFGGYEVSFGEASVSDWAKNFMTSDMGKRLAAATAVPSANLPGSVPGSKARRQVPRSQLKTVSDEDLKNGAIEIVDG